MPSVDKNSAERAADPARVGSSATASADVVGVNRRQEVDDAQQAEPAPGAQLKQPNERDESPADQADPANATQPLRRAGDGAPPVGQQAYQDVAGGLVDTDLYGSGNLASSEDKGRRPDAPIDRGADDDVRRSGHDV